MIERRRSINISVAELAVHVGKPLVATGELVFQLADLVLV